MLGRMARDNPFFFARIDSEIFGDDNILGDLRAFEVHIFVSFTHDTDCVTDKVLFGVWLLADTRKSSGAIRRILP